MRNSGDERWSRNLWFSWLAVTPRGGMTGPGNRQEKARDPSAGVNGITTTKARANRSLCTTAVPIL